MTKLKHSAAEWCYYRKEFAPEDVYRILKEAGYSAVEMVDESRWKAAEAAGLRILNMASPGMQDGINRTENHATLLPALRDLIAKAHSHRIPHIIVFSGSRKGQSDADGMRNCAAALKELSRDAEQAGVTLLLEVLNTFDHADYQCCHGAYAFEVVRAVGSPNIKALYDIYHAHRMGEDVVSVITQNIKSIGHLHIAGSPKRNFPGPRPSQEIDYAKVIQTAMAAGYDGYWGQEFCCDGDPLGEYARACALFESYASR